MHFYPPYSRNGSNPYLNDSLESDDEDDEFIAEPAICLPGFSIHPRRVIKYLGVIFDPELKFGAHVDRVEAETSKRLAIFNALAASTWGIGTMDLRMIYTSTVLPQFLYCASAWYQPKEGNFHGFHRKKYLTFLERVQKRVAIRITGAEELNVELNLLPVELQLEKTLFSTLVRLAAGPAWSFIISFRTMFGGVPANKSYYQLSPLQKLELSFTNSECINPIVCPPWWEAPDFFVENTAAKATVAHNELIFCSVDELVAEKESLNIYSDGSGINGEVGAAWCPQFDTYEGDSVGPLNCFTV